MRKEEFERNVKLLQAGQCVCGNPAIEHGRTIYEMRQVPFHCALLRDEIHAWMVPSTGPTGR